MKTFFILSLYSFKLAKIKAVQDLVRDLNLDNIQSTNMYTITKNYALSSIDL